MHARSPISIFSHAFSFIHAITGAGDTPVPSSDRDEVLLSAVLLLSAFTDIRTAFHDEVVATDAMPELGGACTAVVPPILGGTIFKEGG